MTLKETFASVDAQLDDPVTWGKDGSYVKRCRPSCRTNERQHAHEDVRVLSHGRCHRTS